jgi:hypothetical protein
MTLIKSFKIHAAKISMVLVPSSAILMLIEHSLKNTGKRAIQSSVYNHNFVVLDKQALSSKAGF